MSRKDQPLIFVVDSNSSYRKVVLGCLEALKLSNFKTFDNGEQCYTSNGQAADLIILDYKLGDENWNGIEFMEEYLRIHPSTYFLFLSSHTGVEIAVNSIRKGAIDYILKSKAGLVRLVKQVEGLKDYYKKNQTEKLTRHMIMGAIIAFSTLTALISVLYSIR